MAYRTDINSKDRGGALAAVIAVHALLFLALLQINGKMDVPLPESVMQVIDISRVPPPPPTPPPPPPQQEKPKLKPKKESGGSAPNLKSEATPIKAPKPRVVVPPVPQIATSQTPRNGTAPTQGAANVRGPGTGAGGYGNGTGTGVGGGPGGGGDGGVAEPPHLATPVLTGRDFPRELLDQWPRGATIFMRLRVDARGFVSECTVDRGTGIRSIDSAVCNIAHDRLRFRPALNRNGQAVAGWFGYAQRAPR